MTPEQYVQEAIRTESLVEVKLSEIDTRILHAAMGCVTEAGEMLDALKRRVFYGKPLDPVNLAEEAGDLLWYVAVLSDALNVPIIDIMHTNIAKLRRRYPEKFSPDAALNRDLEAERAVLESHGSIEGELRGKGWTPLTATERDPVCRGDVGDGDAVYDDRPRPGASPEADERSEVFGNDKREVTYLESNGWKKATAAGDGRRETWAINWEFRQSKWPKAVLQKHGNADAQVWTRQEALNVQREIDWFKGV